MNDSIVRFVRDTLGCSCPAEVFEQIEDARLPDPPCPLRRIAVSGRLLIYLVDATRMRPDERILADLLAAGRAERDLLGMNRFRLAVAAADPDAAHAELAPVFERLRGDDERLHLHVLAPEVAPPP